MTSKLAENVVHFTRLLRGAGLRLGPASALEAIAAAASVDVVHRDEFYWALHSVLVKRPEDFDLYDQAFRLFWRDPTRVQPVLDELLQQRARAAGAAGLAAGLRGVAPAGLLRTGRPQSAARSTPCSPSPPTRSCARRDFDQMSAEELARARKIVAPDGGGAAAGPHAALRGRSARRPPRPRAHRARQPQDLRRPGAAALPLPHPPAAAARRPLRHLGLDGTLLRDDAALPARPPERPHPRPRLPVRHPAHQRDADPPPPRRRRSPGALRPEVQDWSGGTRLRACLHDFNRTWSRRVLGQGAVVLLVTDGLDRDPEPGLDAEADRLHRSCRRLIWLNPLLRWEGFQPRAQGVRALLPHVDEHRPVHNLDSLEALGRALA